MEWICMLIADDHPLFREGMHALLSSVAMTEVVASLPRTEALQE